MDSSMSSPHERIDLEWILMTVLMNFETENFLLLCWWFVMIFEQFWRSWPDEAVFLSSALFANCLFTSLQFIRAKLKYHTHVCTGWVVKSDANKPSNQIILIRVSSYLCLLLWHLFSSTKNKWIIQTYTGPAEQTVQVISTWTDISGSTSLKRIKALVNTKWIESPTSSIQHLRYNLSQEVSEWTWTLFFWLTGHIARYILVVLTKMRCETPIK